MRERSDGAPAPLFEIEESFRLLEDWAWGRPPTSSRPRTHHTRAHRASLVWRHSGFAVHNRTIIYPSDTEGLHKLACYLMRPPVNLSRLRYHRDSQLLLYEPKAGQELDDEVLVDPLEFLARVLLHIPEPKKHLVHSTGSTRIG